MKSFAPISLSSARPIFAPIICLLALLHNAHASEGAYSPPPPTDTETVPAPAVTALQNTEWIQEGRQRFVRTCAYCHGQEGEAGKVRSFKTRTNWNPQDIFDTISNGRVRGGNVMPTWKGTIPPDEIWKLVAYIKSLSADFAGQIEAEQ